MTMNPINYNINVILSFNNLPAVSYPISYFVIIRLLTDGAPWISIVPIALLSRPSLEMTIDLETADH